jgi:hypothetical protein
MNKQRKFLMVLPLLVIPFLTMAFWALGGGKNGHRSTNTNKGLDASLPEAQFNKQAADSKMAVYQTASHDSTQNGVSPAFLKAMGLHQPDSAKIAELNTKPEADQSAERIQAKLAAINKQISQPVAATPTYNPQGEASEQKIRQLHQLMQSAKSKHQEEDPEMAQLSKMLTQIQQIQNPASVKVDRKPEENAAFKAIPAIIDGKQKVMDGGAVRLKLTDSVQIKDQWIPKGQQIFGVCSVTNQRLLLTIQNIRLDKQIIPVNLTVFSLDGMPGIPAPEAELGGAAGAGADNALQSMQFLTMDQSLGAQAAAGGVNAAKGLFSKKMKKIKVKLSDQYPVLLKINK